MAYNYTGNQYEYGFKPHKLGNWEQPREAQPKAQASEFGTLRPRTGKTKFIVDEKGHLLEGVEKRSTAFDHSPPVYKKVPARWPQTNRAYRYAPRATMGYKGIMTTYLPSGTVTIKSVDVPGCKETNFR